MTGKLTETSKAVVLLRRKFANGEIGHRSRAQQVHESNEAFKEHKLDNFRTKFNKLKKEYLVEDEGSLWLCLCHNSNCLLWCGY